MKTLPPSALYSHPSLGRLWKKVHLAHSPFLHRPALRRLYTLPATLLRPLLQRNPYQLLALGCADGTKERLLFKKLPPPTHLLAADTNLSLAKQAARSIPAMNRSARRVDLTSRPSLARLLRSHPRPRIITLFGVLPNLPPLPLLRHISQHLWSTDLLLFSANLAPGEKSRAGALRVLPQYDNPATRRWLKAAASRFRPKLPEGEIIFGVFPDPTQPSLARIEARWLVQRRPYCTLFSSRRPTVAQVESWIRSAQLKKIHHWIDPRSEEGLWLVTAN